MKRVGRLFALGNAARLSTYLLALWKLFQHPETPRAAKWAAIAVLAYALSPIDLIPDFIPILGYLDDLLIVPAGLWLALRWVPPALLAEYREQAISRARPRSLVAAVLIVGLWLAAAALIFLALRR